MAAALRASRVSAGLTAADVAARAGIPLDTVRAIEQGRTVTPSFLNVAAIARAVGADLDDLARATWGDQ